MKAANLERFFGWKKGGGRYGWVGEAIIFDLPSTVKGRMTFGQYSRVRDEGALRA